MIRKSRLGLALTYLLEKLLKVSEFSAGATSISESNRETTSVYDDDSTSNVRFGQEGTRSHPFGDEWLHLFMPSVDSPD